MPHLQKIYEELKDKGLGIIALNANDKEELITKYFTESKFTMPAVMGGSGANYTIGKAYGVRAYPTNYLVGADGKVLWRSVGFNEQALRKALADAGLK